MQRFISAISKVEISFSVRNNIMIKLERKDLCHAYRMLFMHKYKLKLYNLIVTNIVWIFSM